MVQFDESGANVSTFGPLPHLRGPFDHGHDRINDERSLIDRFRSLDNNLINGTLPQWSNLINLVDMWVLFLDEVERSLHQVVKGSKKKEEHHLSIDLLQARE